MQDHVPVAPISFATYTATFAEMMLSQKKAKDWATCLVCHRPDESLSATMDLDAPALWQIEELRTIYDNEELEENDDDDDEETKAGMSAEVESFKKKALKSWLNDIGVFFLASWCCDSLMALMRNDLDVAGKAMSEWLDCTSDVETWGRSCHKLLTEAVKHTRTFAMGVLAVLGHLPLNQEVYAAFMASFVNAKTYKSQSLESLRLMVSTLRKNDRWNQLEKQCMKCASQELLMAAELQALSSRLAQSHQPDHATTKDMHKQLLKLRPSVRSASLNDVESRMASVLETQAKVLTDKAFDNLTDQEIVELEFLVTALAEFEHSPQYQQTQSALQSCNEHLSKWRQEKRLKTLVAMSEGAEAVQTKQLIQTLDALQSTELDPNVLQGLERELQKALKVVAASADAEKKSADQLLDNLGAVKESLSIFEDTDKHSKIKYDFVGKLMAAGLQIRCAHGQWKSSGGKAPLLSFIKAHSSFGDLTITREMHASSHFYKDLAAELVKGNADALRALKEEKKKRAADAANVVWTLIKECDQWAHGLRDGSSWKAQLAEDATLEEILTLAGSKGQLLSGPGAKVISTKSTLEEVVALDCHHLFLAKDTLPQLECRIQGLDCKPNPPDSRVQVPDCRGHVLECRPQLFLQQPPK